MPRSAYWVTNKRHSPSVVSMSSNGTMASDNDYDKLSYHQENCDPSHKATKELFSQPAQDKENDTIKASNNTPIPESDSAPLLPSLENPFEQEEREKQTRIGQILYDAFEELGKRPGSGGLAASKWAIDGFDDNEHYLDKVARIKAEAAVNNANKAKFGAVVAQESRRQVPSVKSTTTSSSSFKSQTVNRVSQAATRVAAEKRNAMSSIDDTRAFMAAVTNRFGPLASMAPSKDEVRPTATARLNETKSVEKAVQTSTSLPNVAAPREPTVGVPASQGDDNIEKPVRPIQAPAKKEEVSLRTREEKSSPPKPASTLAPAPAGEDREHMVRFSTWGTPPPRDAPAARVRRVILRNLPSFINTPTKVQSLIFGGQVESFAISATGTAVQVMFCDADAAKRFFDEHPNGIPVNNNGRTGVVFVDFGQDVDVVSSQLRTHLNLGATRVVRAIGAETDISMAELIHMATKKNLKLEKIIDVYEPGDKCRTVTFRFCSIDDASRFRGILLRDEAWEQCNIQYAADPCATAKAIHWD